MHFILFFCSLWKEKLLNVNLFWLKEKHCSCFLKEKPCKKDESQRLKAYLCIKVGNLFHFLDLKLIQTWLGNFLTFSTRKLLHVPQFWLIFISFIPKPILSIATCVFSSKFVCDRTVLFQDHHNVDYGMETPLDRYAYSNHLRDMVSIFWKDTDSKLLNCEFQTSNSKS